jgi:Holliday junction resolvase RusA-like endonuclease
VVRLIVYGVPGPQGSKRFVGVSKKTGRGIMIESSAAVKTWRQDVKSAAEGLRVMQSLATLDGPLAARMVFTVRKPASAPKRRRTFPATKPDLSKLIRSTEDALTDAGLIADDARIVEYDRAAKVYPGEDPEALDAPGVRIELRELAAVTADVRHPAPADVDLFSKETSP